MTTHRTILTARRVQIGYVLTLIVIFGSLLSYASVRLHTLQMPSLMMDAAKRGDAQAVEDLLEKDVNPNFSLNENGPTPLMQAIYSGSSNTVRVLLEHGARPDQIHLIMAFRLMHQDIARLLLAHGANPNAADGRGYTMLMDRANNGDIAAVRVLLEAGANVRTKCDGGRPGYNALMYAASQGNTDIVKALIQAGSEVNARGKDGNTALALAAAGKHSETVAFLKQIGAKE